MSATFASRFVRGFNAPATSAIAVTPSDSTDIASTSRALYIGTGGTLTVTMADGVDATFSSVPSGAVMPICVKRVKSTGTSASNIVALW